MVSKNLWEKKTVLKPTGEWAKTSLKFLLLILHSLVWISVFQSKTEIKTASTELNVSCLNHCESLYYLSCLPAIIQNFFFFFNKKWQGCPFAMCLLGNIIYPQNEHLCLSSVGLANSSSPVL